MKPKTLLLTVFILVALIQLFIPYKMIRKQAGFAETGTEFKFKTESPGNFKHWNVHYCSIGNLPFI